MNMSYCGSHDTVQIVAEKELAPGEVVKVESRLGVVQGMNTISAGEVAELAMDGVFVAPVSTSGTYSFGLNLSYDETGGMLTPTGTSGSGVVARYWGTADTGATGEGKVYLTPVL